MPAIRYATVLVSKEGEVVVADQVLEPFECRAVFGIGDECI
jgi:hypothetical protein